MTTTYNHTGKGGIVRKAENAQHAADIIARREYGKRGFCRSLRHDSRTEDGRSHTYEAFIGRAVPGQPGTTAGRNVWIYETHA